MLAIFIAIGVCRVAQWKVAKSIKKARCAGMYANINIMHISSLDYIIMERDILFSFYYCILLVIVKGYILYINLVQ